MADNKYLDLNGLKKVFGLIKGTTYTKTEVDGKVADMATKDWVGKEGFLKEANLAGYAKTADVVSNEDYNRDKATFATKTAAIGAARYDDQTKKIVFTSVSGTEIGNGIDCTAFIKDGMVNTVEVTTGTGDNNKKQVLKITFNSDAGKEAIEVPIENIFNPSNYYTKSEVDTELAKKVDSSTYGTDKTATDNRITALENWKGSHSTEYSTLSDKVTALENAAITWAPFTAQEIEQAYTDATASTIS